MPVAGGAASFAMSPMGCVWEIMTDEGKALFCGSASPLAIAGAALSWLWMDQAVFTSVLTGPALYERAFLVMTLCTVACVPLFAYVLRGVDVLGGRCRIAALAWGALGALGGILMLAVGEASAAGLAGAVLCGMAFAWGNLVWGWVCVAQGHDRALVHIAAAWALGLPANLVLAALPHVVAGVLVCLLIPLSAALLVVLCLLRDRPGLRIEETRPHKVSVVSPGSMAFGVDGRLLALILAFCCAFGLMYFQQASQADPAAVAGVQKFACAVPVHACSLRRISLSFATA